MILNSDSHHLDPVNRLTFDFEPVRIAGLRTDVLLSLDGLLLCDSTARCKQLLRILIAAAGDEKVKEALRKSTLGPALQSEAKRREAHFTPDADGVTAQTLPSVGGVIVHHLVGGR
jgi:hypothetical protein